MASQSSLKRNSIIFTTNILTAGLDSDAVHKGGNTTNLLAFGSSNGLVISGMANTANFFPGSFTIAGSARSASSNNIVISASGTATTVASSMPIEIDLQATAYDELNRALLDLQNLESDQDWNIERLVYGASIQVTAVLMENNIPAPNVFTHGPKSVVFNWRNVDKNLYVTATRPCGRI